MEINISGKRIVVYRTEPSSSVSDYDYGDYCRYISSYNNHFEVYSDIINLKIVDLIMPDDTVESIIKALEELSDNLGIDCNSSGTCDSISITLPPISPCLEKTITFCFSRLPDGKIGFCILMDQVYPYPIQTLHDVKFQVFMDEIDVLSLHQTLSLLLEEYPTI